MSESGLIYCDGCGCIKNECKCQSFYSAHKPAPTTAGLDGSSGLFAPVEGADCSERPVHSLAHSRPQNLIDEGGECPICGAEGLDEDELLRHKVCYHDH